MVFVAEALDRSTMSLQCKVMIVLAIIFVLICLCKSASDFGDDGDPDKEPTGGAAIVGEMIARNPNLMKHMFS